MAKTCEIRIADMHFVKEMLFTARRIPAARMAAYGVLNAVVPAAELERTTADLAADIASTSPLVHRIMWEMIGPRLVDSVYEPSIDRLETQALTIAVAALRASGRRMRDALVYDTRSFRRLEAALYRIPDKVREVRDVPDR